MAFGADDLVANSQLYVGYGDAKKVLGVGAEKIRGSAFIQGPTIIGDPAAFDQVEATLMIGPARGIDLPQVPISPAGSEYRKQSGVALVDTTPPVYEDPETKELIPVGDPRYVPFILPAEIPEGIGGGIACEPLENLALVVKGGAKIVEDFHVAGNVVSSGEVTAACSVTLTSRKPFDIPHPSKEGWRLRHVCIEGPESGIYCRGRVKNKTEITLPNYWKGFVDIDSITVNLTPIGSHQDVIIKRWDEEKIYLQSRGGMPIDCFYYICAERIDGEKLIVEYQGNSIDDYPGDNSIYSINK
jgi:hypothetical protein